MTPFLGGGTAVLLQVAHPLVAAGVVEHSDFHRDLWRRLVRTLRALYLIVYGTKAEAEQAAAIVPAVHAHVRGVTREPLGRFPAGTPYSATTPELMLWVHATLVQASLSAYQRFAEKLTSADEESYYQEMALRVPRRSSVAAHWRDPGSADRVESGPAAASARCLNRLRAAIGRWP